MSQKSEAEGILYELLVYSEWIKDPEILVCTRSTKYLVTVNFLMNLYFF